MKNYSQEERLISDSLKMYKLKDPKVVIEDVENTDKAVISIEFWCFGSKEFKLIPVSQGSLNVENSLEFTGLVKMIRDSIYKIIVRKSQEVETITMTISAFGPTIEIKNEKN